VLLQVLFHAQIGRERKTFTIEDVLETLAEKLIRRHPHVFGETTNNPPVVKTAEEVVHRWEEIKRQEKAGQSDNGEAGSALDGVPKSLPALLRAYQLQVRAARVGFDWPHDETGYDQSSAKSTRSSAKSPTRGPRRRELPRTRPGAGSRRKSAISCSRW